MVSPASCRARLVPSETLASRKRPKSGTARPRANDTTLCRWMPRSGALGLVLALQPASTENNTAAPPRAVSSLGK